MTTHSHSRARAFLVAGACLIAAGLLAGGCATLAATPSALSTEEEVRLGAAMAAEVREKEAVLDDAVVQEYVDDIGRRLARHAPRTDVEYTFTVIDAPDTINAFALPGGYLYVYTGLMKLCENEAQLAGVMAHEIAHVAAEHHGESLSRMMRIQGARNIVRALLGEERQALADAVATIGGAAGQAYYSKEDEREADRMGMEMLFRAGYKPEAMVDFMELMFRAEQQAGRGAGPGWLEIFSSHPPTDERYEHLRYLAAGYPLEMRMESPVYAERYQAIRGRLE